MQNQKKPIMVLTSKVVKIEDDPIQCPCQNFAAIPKILEAIDSEQRMKALLAWLDGDTDSISLEKNRRLSCGKRPRCRFRYGTSIAILNAIRDACRHYLEPGSVCDVSINLEEPVSLKNVSDLTVNYDNAFPSLVSTSSTESKAMETTSVIQHPAATNILIPRKKKSSSGKGEKVEERKNLKPKKTKRRIRPQPTATSVTSKTAWGQSNPNTDESVHGSTSNLRSQNALHQAKWKTLNVPSTGHVVQLASDKNAKTTMTQVEKNLDHKAAETIFMSGNSSTVFPTSEENLSRLVDIYTSLITNHLVPSTALELHLLMRLLTLSSKGTRFSEEPHRSNNQTPIFFAPVFCAPVRCRTFAIRALNKLVPVLKNLGVALLKGLVRCDAFRTTLPELADKLQSILERRIGQGLLTESPSDAVTGSHAILTLPFQQSRDSRHNYRTQAEVAMYKNREVTRDAFLRQLRAFMDIRGKVLRSQESDRALERIRKESMSVLKGILSVNMIWFAQFFCDLLLQIGLTPMEETDQELLSIADKDKLQKLHKRFSSKGPQANQSSKKLVLSQSKDSTAALPVVEAQHQFPGHQEFFFSFLQSTENYNFGIHLRSRISAMIIDCSSYASSNNVERRLMNLQLLARLLGYLLFSPNWHGAGIDLRNVNPLTSVDVLQQLDSLGLTLETIVEDAWNQGHVAAVVPWVTEFLKMAKWDSSSQSSKRYRRVLSHLRFIQEHLHDSDAASKRYGPTMQMVSFYLETFFHETVGFAKLSSLPKATLGTTFHINEDDSNIDTSVRGFSSVILFASNPHVEDLSTLITTLSSPLGKSSSKTKKLRPSVVSRGVETATLFSETLVSGSSFSTVTDWTTNTQNSSATEVQSRTFNIEVKLADAFFHQHRGLKEVCEFAVKRVLKNTASCLTSVCIKPIFDENEITVDSTEQSFDEIKVIACERSRAFLRSSLDDTVRKSLELLGPSDTKAKVLEIAVSLAISRGAQTGEPMIDALVTTELNTLRDSLARMPKKEKKRQSTNTSPNSAVANDGLSEVHLDAVVDAITKVRDVLEDCLWETDAEYVAKHIKALEAALDKWDNSLDTKIPSDIKLRFLYECILQIDEGAPLFMQWCLCCDIDKFRLLVPSYLRVLTKLTHHTKRGTRRLVQLLSESDLLSSVIKSGLSTTPKSDIDGLGSLLSEMIESRLITMPRLRFVLDSVRETPDINREQLQEFFRSLSSTPQGSSMLSVLGDMVELSS